MYSEIIKKMDEYLGKHEAEILNVILELVKYPSIKSEPSENAPFGKNSRECLDKAVEIMKDYGFCANVSADGSYGLATYGSGEKTIGIFAHTDVVPVTP